MPAIDNSDNPLKGFELRAEDNKLFLVCRASGMSVFHYYQRLRRITYLDDILNLAAAHRIQCKAPVQAIKTELALEISWINSLTEPCAAPPE